MKTVCHCVFCKKHPLNYRRDEFSSLDVPVGFEVGRIVVDSKVGVEVQCLEPESPAFDELFVNKEDFEYPITAYGDGGSVTGVERRGFTIFATCINEEYDGGL